jgi:hypothetical protein
MWRKPRPNDDISSRSTDGTSKLDETDEEMFNLLAKNMGNYEGKKQ